MKMKLRLRARHEHADSEQRCTSDLKNATCRLRPGGGLSHGHTACKPASGRAGVVHYEDGDSSPLNILLKQEGLQLAEASSRDKFQTCLESNSPG